MKRIVKIAVLLLIALAIYLGSIILAIRITENSGSGSHTSTQISAPWQGMTAENTAGMRECASLYY